MEREKEDWVFKRQANKMSSNIKVTRVCDFCGNSFVAKTTVTRYCTKRCNERSYKAARRGEKIERSDLETSTKILRPIEELKAKEYLSVNETCKLIGISRMTLHRLIKKKEIKKGSIGRRVIIRKSEIERLLQ